MPAYESWLRPAQRKCKGKFAPAIKTVPREIGVRPERRSSVSSTWASRPCAVCAARDEAALG